MTRKKEETVGFFLLVRPPRRRNLTRDARAPHFALSGENPNRAPAARSRIKALYLYYRKPGGFLDPVGHCKPQPFV